MKNHTKKRKRKPAGCFAGQSPVKYGQGAKVRTIFQLTDAEKQVMQSVYDRYWPE